MVLTKLLTIDEVNNLISEHFIKIFGNVVENSTATAIGILKNRPFEKSTDIYHAISAHLDSLKICDKEKLLQAHPDMVSKLTDLSRLMLEQEINIEGTLENYRPSVQEKLKLKDLNRAYIKKFGFPFISCGKQNFLDVFTDIEARVNNTKEEEIETSIKEVRKICKLRIFEIVH